MGIYVKQPQKMRGDAKQPRIRSDDGVQGDFPVKASWVWN